MASRAKILQELVHDLTELNMRTQADSGELDSLYSRLNRLPKDPELSKMAAELKKKLDTMEDGLGKIRAVFRKTLDRALKQASHSDDAVAEVEPEVMKDFQAFKKARGEIADLETKELLKYMQYMGAKFERRRLVSNLLKEGLTIFKTVFSKK